MEHIIRTQKPKLADTTISNYLKNINRLYLSYNTDIGNITDLEWIYDKVNLQKFLDNLKTDNTRKTYYTIIITLLQYDITHNKNIDKQPLMDYWTKKTIKNFKQNSIKQLIITTKNEEKIITIDLYNELLDKLKIDNELQPLLMFSILKLYPFRNEVSSFILSNGKKMDSDKNYLVINKNQMKFIRNVYKTFGKYGSKTDIITDKKLKKMIINYITELDIKNNEYLFTFKNEPITNIKTTALLQQYSNKYIKHKLSTTIIFKTIINDWILDKPRTETELLQYLEQKGSIRGTDNQNLINYYVNKKSLTLID